MQARLLPVAPAPRSSPMLETARPVDREVTIGGLKLHYLEWGAEGAPGIIMLHGVMQQAHSYDWVAREFAHDYRVIVPDTRGHGDSEWAPEGQYTNDHFQSDLLGIADHVGFDKFVLVGLSMGGMISIRFASALPDRLRGLGIVDISPSIRKEGSRNIRNFAVGDVEIDFEELLQRSMKFNPTRTEESLRGSLKNNLRPLPNGKWTWKYDKHFRTPREDPEPQRPDLVPHLDNIRNSGVPTIFFRGAKSDVVSEEDAQDLLKHLPDAHYVVIENATHTVPGDQPLAFANALRSWLNDKVETNA